jgi:hypothetical protein
VQKVNAEVGNAHALLLDVSVTQMFAEIAGLGNEFRIFDANTSPTLDKLNHIYWFSLIYKGSFLFENLKLTPNNT